MKPLFLCALLFTCYCSMAVGQMAMDCCLQVKNKEVSKKLVVDYKEQIGGQGCAIDAMLLVTRPLKNYPQRTLCVPLSKPWVKEIVKHVNDLKMDCKNHGYKPRRCRGVRVE